MLLVGTSSVLSRLNRSVHKIFTFHYPTRQHVGQDTDYVEGLLQIGGGVHLLQPRHQLFREPEHLTHFQQPFFHHQLP
ncbi:unnamed protein product, partial [Linum tenue]